MSIEDSDLVVFTKRTDYPKLGWLKAELEHKGIECHIIGESWHAPMSWVHEKDLDAAWAILEPVDDIPDDDEMYAAFDR